ncbi:MAG: DUF2497 domain-containing protein [Alphaproteobacteria bacterium]|nr:DUF2497 domain-containing protein [Alphaproteobacteria bacterium]
MAEILSSIRRIIADDARNDPKLADLVAAAPVVDEVADEVANDAASADPQDSSWDDDGDILRLTRRISGPGAISADLGSEGSKEGLILSYGPAASAEKSFEALREAAATKPPERRDSWTADDLLRRVIIPIFKDWMDAHLPGLVERLVRAEISRISDRAPRRG